MPWGWIGAALWLSEFLRRNETYFRSLLHSPWSQPWWNVSPAERGADSRLMKGKTDSGAAVTTARNGKRNLREEERIDFAMTTSRICMLALVTNAVFAAAASPQSEAWAQHNPPPVPLPVPQVTPQFNDPGPQVVIPPPGNPVQQLSPSLGTAAPVYSGPQIYVVPDPTPEIAAPRSRHHGAKHRRVSRSRGVSGRSSEPPPSRAR